MNNTVHIPCEGDPDCPDFFDSTIVESTSQLVSVAEPGSVDRCIKIIVLYRHKYAYSYHYALRGGNRNKDYRNISGICVHNRIHHSLWSECIERGARVSSNRFVLYYCLQQ